jgi:Fe-S cluster biogenesis protein NfuA
MSLSEEPSDLRARVQRVLRERIAPALQMDDTAIEVLEASQGEVRLRLSGGVSCCPSSVLGIILELEEELRRQLPEIHYVEVVS